MKMNRQHTQNIESVLTLTDELNKVRIENENLRRIVRDGQEPVSHRTFLKGVGAGIAFTPAFLWICWKLMELVNLAAGYIQVPPMLFGTVSVCIGTGLALFTHSAAVCRGAQLLLNGLLDCMLDDEDEKENEK